MSTSKRSILKVAVMNWVFAVIFIIFGAVLTYLGRNDPPSPPLLSLFLSVLFVGCPLVCLFTGIALMQSTTSWRTTMLSTLNVAVCILGVLFALLAFLGHRLTFEMLLGFIILFLPFALNIAALSRHMADPGAVRTEEYRKRK